MRGVRPSRRRATDLLTRSPCGGRTSDNTVGAWMIDPVEQIEELADLLRRGLVSREEFDHHKAKIIGAEAVR